MKARIEKEISAVAEVDVDITIAELAAILAAPEDKWERFRLLDTATLMIQQLHPLISEELAATVKDKRKFASSLRDRMEWVIDLIEKWEVTT